MNQTKVINPVACDVCGRPMPIPNRQEGFSALITDEGKSMLICSPHCLKNYLMNKEFRRKLGFEE